MSAGPAEPTEAESRRRHPCSSWAPPTAPLRAHVTAEIAASGGRHPAVAAAVLEVRGRSGLDRPAFAARAGVDASIVEAAESGELSRAELPGALRRMVPIPDPARPLA